MSKKLKIKIGDRYERLVVLGKAPSKNGHSRVLCRCDCGNTAIPLATHLKSGRSKSCGCLSKELFIKRVTRHGLCKKKLYHIWRGIKARCFDKNCIGYKHYGGRGITICKEWLEVVSFYEWAMNNGYIENLTIERIDNNGDYKPDNCEWIPLSEQGKNTRSCIPVMISGINFPTLKDATHYFNIKYTTAYARLRKGLSIQQALGV